MRLEDNQLIPLPKPFLLFVTRMDGRYLLCISFFFALIQSTAAFGDMRKKPLNTSVVHHTSASDSPGTMNEEKPRGIFNRRRSVTPTRQHVTRPKPEKGSTRPGPVRYCARMMEPCSGHTPCCSPCALCHCRLFNTICQCWKTGECSRKN